MCIPLLPVNSACPTHIITLALTILRVQVIKLLNMQLPPTACHSILLWYEFSTQHIVLKHPQSMFFLKYQRQSFTLIQNHSQNYGSHVKVSGKQKRRHNILN
jgi:hypothetical protein